MRRDGKDDSDAAVSDTLAPATSATVLESQIDTARRGDLVGPTATLAPADPGRYAISDEIGRGGLGRIMRARDHHLGRHVAIKELLHAHEDLVSRFAREALVTARLMHPSIVPVYDAGTWPSGLPFYAMKMVAGRSLDQVFTDATTLPARLALLGNVIAVADAMAYAHSEGIIHRDLKPANVLVGSFGETVVIDWGLAKDLRAPDRELAPVAVHGTETVVGAVMGTPSYMPPEQAMGEPVDARADVYALGALLYHLFAGVPPYVGPTADSVLELVLREAPRPLPSLAADLPPELATIIAKAMARDPAARYPTATELAADLRRFQTGGLVSAHLYTAGALLRRWIARHRAVVAVSAVALAVLFVGGGYAIHRILDERAAAIAGETKARERADDMTLAQASAELERDPSGAIRALALLSPAAPAASWATAREIAADAQTRGLAQRELVLGEYVDVAGFLPSGDAIVYDQAAIYRWSLKTGRVARIAATPHDALSIALSPDGALLAVRLELPRQPEREGVQLVETATGVLRPVLPMPHLAQTAFTPDSRRLVVLGSTLAIVELADGTRRDVAIDASAINMHARLAIAPDGATAVFSTWRDVARCDLAAASCALIPEAGSDMPGEGHGMTLAVSPSGTHIVWAGYRDLSSVELRGGPITRVSLLLDGLGHLAYTPDARYMAGTSTGPDGILYIWKLARARREDLVVNAQLTDLAMGADRAVAGTSKGVMVALFDDLEVRWLHGQRDAIRSVAIRGTQIVSASADGTVRLWDLAPAPPPCGMLSDHALAVSSDHAIAIAADGPAYRVCDVAANLSHEVTPSTPLTWVDAAIAPDGRRAVIASEQGLVVLEIATGKVTRLSPDPFAHVVWGAGGISATSLSAIVTSDGTSVRSIMSSDDPRLFSLAPDARHVVETGYRISGARTDARLLDLATGAATSLAGFEAFAFSPTGDRLAVATIDGRMRVISIATGAIATLDDAGGVVSQLAWASDGHALSAVAGSALRLWDVDSGHARVALRARGKGSVVAASYAPDGSRIAALTGDNAVYLVDVSTLTTRLLGKLALPPHGIRFWPDGKAIVAETDGGLATWRDELPRDPAALHDWLVGAGLSSARPD